MASSDENATLQVVPLNVIMSLAFAISPPHAGAIFVGALFTDPIPFKIKYVTPAVAELMILSIVAPYGSMIAFIGGNVFAGRVFANGLNSNFVASVG